MKGYLFALCGIPFLRIPRLQGSFELKKATQPYREPKPTLTCIPFFCVSALRRQVDN